MKSKSFSLLAFKKEQGVDVGPSVVLTVDGVTYVTRSPSLVPKLLKEIEKKHHKKASIEVIPGPGILTV